MVGGLEKAVAVVGAGDEAGARFVDDSGGQVGGGVSVGIPVGDPSLKQVIYLDLEADSAEGAIAVAEAMCRKLLANPVTEDFIVSLADALEGAER